MPAGVLLGLVCPRCEARFPVEARFDGCPRCAPAVPVNLTPVYDLDARARAARVEALRDGPPSMWRYEALLPVGADAELTLGEGLTPLLPCPRLGRRLGIPRLFWKDESRNPTWSFKDRLASVAVAMAGRFGARVIACSSSGNAGAAAAAYAARAGLPCVVITFEGAAGPTVTQMRAYGAMVVATREKGDRWKLLRRCVDELGWYPTTPYFGPPVGSNTFGIEGYKTIAYEVTEQLGGRPPDWCVLPVAYGDALAGMWRGFEDLGRLGVTSAMPRMIAAEVYGSLAAAEASRAESPPVVAKDHETVALSIGTLQSTWQALHVLRASRGFTHRAGDADLGELQAALAESEGIYAEPSSVAPLAAVGALRARGVIAEHETVVALGTATGLKDPDATVCRLGPLPTVAADLEALLDTLAATYRFSPGGS